MANIAHASTVIGSNDNRVHVTLDHEWPFPRKNTEKIGANNAAQHHGTTTMAESLKILREKQISLSGQRFGAEIMLSREL